MAVMWQNGFPSPSIKQHAVQSAVRVEDLSCVRVCARARVKEQNDAESRGFYQKRTCARPEVRPHRARRRNWASLVERQASCARVLC